MLADVHLLARAVAEILDNLPQALAVGARIYPHRRADGDPGVRGAVSFRLPIGLTHVCTPPRMCQSSTISRFSMRNRCGVVRGLRRSGCATCRVAPRSMP